MKKKDNDDNDDDNDDDDDKDDINENNTEASLEGQHSERDQTEAPYFLKMLIMILMEGQF